MDSLFDEMSRIFISIADKSDGSIKYYPGNTEWIVHQTPLILSVHGLLYDSAQDLLGLIFLENDENPTACDNFLSAAAYCAERTKATAQSLTKLPFDWHVFLISNRSDMGPIMSKITSQYKSVPYGISVLQASDSRKHLLSQAIDFSRFALSQDQALSSLKLDEERRYQMVLSLIGIDTKSISEALKESQSQANTDLKATFTDLGIGTRLRVTSAQIRQTLKNKFGEPLEKNLQRWPDTIKQLGQLWSEFCTETDALVSALFTGDTPDEEIIGSFNLRLQNLEKEHQTVSSYYRVYDLGLNDAFQTAVLRLTEWEQYLKQNSSSKESTNKDVSPPRSNKAEVLIAAANHVKQIRALRRGIRDGIPVIGKLRQQVSSVYSPNQDRPFASELSKMGVEVEHLDLIIKELSDALQTSTDKMQTLLNQISDATLASVHEKIATELEQGSKTASPLFQPTKTAKTGIL